MSFVSSTSLTTTFYLNLRIQTLTQHKVYMCALQVTVHECVCVHEHAMNVGDGKAYLMFVTAANRITP